LAVLLSAALLWALTVSGGIRGLLAVAPLQCALLVAAYVLMLSLGMGRAGGLGMVLQAAPPWSAEPAALAGSFLLFLCGETLAPPYVRSLLLARDSASGRRGVVAAGVVSAALFVVSGLAGLTTRVLLPGISAEAALPALLAAVLPVGLRGVGAAGVLSGLMACGSAYLCAAVDNFRGDVLRMEAAPGGATSNLWMPALFVTVAAAAALWSGDVLGALALAYSLWAPAITVPLLAAALLRNPPPALFALCAGTGVAGMVVWELCGNPLNIPGAVFGIIIAGIAGCRLCRHKSDAGHRETTSIAGRGCGNVGAQRRYESKSGRRETMSIAGRVCGNVGAQRRNESKTGRRETTSIARDSGR
jgi:Na+/proline symporter